MSMIQGFGLAVLLGVLLGTAHLAALWSAVRRLDGSARQLRSLLLGAALRVSVLVGGLFLATDGQAQWLAGAMVGLLLTRAAVMLFHGRERAGSVIG